MHVKFIRCVAYIFAISTVVEIKGKALLVRDRVSETVSPRPCVRGRVSETVCPRPKHDMHDELSVHLTLADSQVAT